MDYGPLMDAIQSFFRLAHPSFVTILIARPSLKSSAGQPTQPIPFSRRDRTRERTNFRQSARQTAEPAFFEAILAV